MSRLTRVKTSSEEETKKMNEKEENHEELLRRVGVFRNSIFHFPEFQTVFPFHIFHFFMKNFPEKWKKITRRKVPSFVRNYVHKTNKNSRKYSLKGCNKEILCAKGTGGLIYHLRV